MFDRPQRGCELRGGGHPSALEGDLQRELERLLLVQQQKGPYATLWMWKWALDAAPLVGGQDRVITPELDRANIAVFVFKERVGKVTWQELERCRTSQTDPIPLIVVFPDQPPELSRMKDLQTVNNWAELVARKTELTADWTKEDSRSVTPAPDYRDLQHLKEIVSHQIKFALTELLRPRVKQRSPSGAMPEQGRLFAEHRHLSYDRLPMLRHGVEDLDQNLLRDFLERPLARRIAQQAGLQRPSPAQHLEALGCLFEGQLVLGAFFCFASAVLLTDKFGACSLQMVVYDNRSRAASRASITVMEGNLLGLFEQGMAWLTNSAGLLRRGQVGSRDRDELEIPEIVLREALANALIHRDYEKAGLKDQPTRIEVYPDRVEITSFGDSLRLSRYNS